MWKSLFREVRVESLTSHKRSREGTEMVGRPKKNRIREKVTDETQKGSEGPLAAK